MPSEIITEISSVLLKLASEFRVAWSNSREQSDEIGELAGALAKAQAKFKGAAKDSKNPHLGNTYADLESVWDAIREPLTENELCALQTTTTATDGTPELITTLAHSSGQWVKGRLPLILLPQKRKDGSVGPVDMQTQGSAITYARRYSLAAICGIVQTDDDGNAASGRTGSAEATKPPATKPPAPPKSESAQASAASSSAAKPAASATASATKPPANTATATEPPSTTPPPAAAAPAPAPPVPATAPPTLAVVHPDERPGRAQIGQILQAAVSNGWDKKVANDTLVAALEQMGVDVTDATTILATWTWEIFNANAKWFGENKQP